MEPHGQPGAWIVRMPVVDLLGDVSWRLGWLAVPFAASALAMLTVASRPSDTAAEPARGIWSLLRRSPAVAGWAIGELLAFSAWAGTLVFAGALFLESYDASPGTARTGSGRVFARQLPRAPLDR